MTLFSKNGKFEIIDYQHDDDSYFYSDTKYYWHVASTKTGDELYRFSGHDYAGRGSASEGGVENVYFDDENNQVVTEHYNGKVEKHPLPEDITICDDGKAVLVKYKNAKPEKRERQEVFIFTKFGQPISRPLKMPK